MADSETITTADLKILLLKKLVVRVARSARWRANTDYWHNLCVTKGHPVSSQIMILYFHHFYFYKNVVFILTQSATLFSSQTFFPDYLFITSTFCSVAHTVHTFSQGTLFVSMIIKYKQTSYNVAQWFAYSVLWMNNESFVHLEDKKKKKKTKNVIIMSFLLLSNYWEVHGQPAKDVMFTTSAPCYTSLKHDQCNNKWQRIYQV